MKLFPDSTDITLEEESNIIKKSFAFNFDKKQFVIEKGSPKLIKDKEAIKNWITLLLKVYFEGADIYKGKNFGTKIKDLIGNHIYPVGFIESEIERDIKEKAHLNPFIQELSAFYFIRTKRGLNIQFTVILNNGERLEVSYDG